MGRSSRRELPMTIADAAAAAPLLDVRGVTLQYKTKEHIVMATFRVDFQVWRSDRFVLLGPSGCGKSTLLKAVGGYLPTTDGAIRRKMGEELLQLWDDTRFTVIFVTHSIPEAVKLGNRILLLSPHPGQVKAELNSSGRDDVDPKTGMRLSDRIHNMLFKERVEEEVAHV